MVGPSCEQAQQLCPPERREGCPRAPRACPQVARGRAADSRLPQRRSTADSFLCLCPCCPKLYAKLFPVVREQLGAHLRPEEDRENLAAEVCLAACLAFRCRGSAEELRHYAAHLVENAVRDIGRRRRLRAQAVWLAPTIESDLAAAVTDRAVVRQALEGLSEKLRTVLVLHDGDGYSLVELSAMLELPKGAVRKRLARGRRQLHALLCEAGFRPPPPPPPPPPPDSGNPRASPLGEVRHGLGRSAQAPQYAVPASAAAPVGGGGG